ncbi:hypothetical protein [Bradyrhizobium japonicum]|nr:hypothetical protein [Bradyrhizobium japonicum]
MAAERKPDQTENPLAEALSRDAHHRPVLHAHLARRILSINTFMPI